MNVLVTGAAKRIGRVIAIELSRQGFAVGIHYSHRARKPRKFHAAAAALRSFKPISLVSRKSIACLAKSRPAWDNSIALVNNAARFTRFDPLDIREADWDFIHDVNLKATFFCCQEGARQMKKKGAGRIVNISSLGGIRPWAEHAHYCASKAGVIMLTESSWRKPSLPKSA